MLSQVHDLMADLLTDVCHDVNVESCLQPLSSEIFTCSTATEDNSRLAIAASAFCCGRLREHLSM